MNLTTMTVFPAKAKPRIQTILSATKLSIGFFSSDGKQSNEFELKIDSNKNTFKGHCHSDGPGYAITRDGDGKNRLTGLKEEPEFTPE
jgi:hypothetical protein